MTFNEQQQIRLDKRQELLDLGVQPYPTSGFVSNTTIIENILNSYSGILENGEVTSVIENITGRVIFKRRAGKIAFVTLQSGSGYTLQGMLKADVLGSGDIEEGKQEIKKFDQTVNLGDLLWVKDNIASSNTGELSVQVTSWQIASKAINPLPTLHHELSEEKAVRERYAQLIVDDNIRQNMVDRSKIVASIRSFLAKQYFVEIETPILQNIHGGAQAKPFKTHFNAFNQDVSLRIALELNLKKAVVGGFDRVFEIGKVFRNEGADSTHSPEFTMLEAYEAFGDQLSVGILLQNLIKNAAKEVEVSKLNLGEETVDFSSNNLWPWIPFYEKLSVVLGEDLTVDTNIEDLREIANRHSVEFDENNTAGRLAMRLFEEMVEETLVQPVFIYDFPAEAQPLARRHDDDSRLVQAWDLFINGKEIGTGFTELNDPVVQREILTAQSLKAANGDPEAMELDEDFLNALQYGAPPMGGLGLGIDRLVMLLLGVSSIRDVQMFPFVRA